LAAFAQWEWKLTETQMATRKTPSKSTGTTAAKSPAKSAAKPAFKASANVAAAPRQPPAPAAKSRRALAVADAEVAVAPGGDVPGHREHPAETPVGEARYRWIAHAAYLRAEKRGFAPGQEVEDWLAAEMEFLAAHGLSKKD
jgi:hypothetical protein